MPAGVRNFFLRVLQVLTESDGRVHVETTKGHCVFTIEGAERQDEGIYSVVVRNAAGEDTADINVKVVGERPLATTDTHFLMLGCCSYHLDLDIKAFSKSKKRLALVN